MSGWSDLQEALRIGPRYGVVFWNNRYPIGTKVVIQRDSGENFETTTRSKAVQLPCGLAVVWVHGIASCYALENVFPMAAPANLEALEEGAIK